MSEVDAITLRYFAWIRTRIGMSTEAVDLPETVGDVAGLIEWLRGRGSPYAAALQPDSAVRVAVNHSHVDRRHPVRPGDEVALFPPVTGG